LYRAAFITGQSPIRTGLTKVGLPGADLGLQPEDPTIADVLKPLGYVCGQFGKNHLGDRDEFLPTAHGFDEFFGNLYHLNAEQEPENPDYPRDPEFKKKYGPRGVLHSWANADGTQKIENTGPLTVKRMETVDEEFLEGGFKFMEKSVKDGKPFFGIGTSDREIKALVATLQSLPRQHPLVTVLRASRDAQNDDALADALLNPRDRSYSVPQLFDYIDRNGMTFGRWYWQAPYLPQCGAIAATPHAERLAALPPRDQYTAMELWRGTMTAYSVVVHRSDAAKDTGIRFDDERWLRFVPIRLPWTQLIRERLPAAAAGALLNRSHPHHDLILVIDAADEGLFAAIDGRRSIADSAKHDSGDRPRARALFEKLWWYDQVVFDASSACDEQGLVM